jgi:hypothetical protein
MRSGFTGRLVDKGVTIGKLVIEQVYPDGSRARVDGVLSAPVTHETVAEIDVPTGSLPSGDEAPEQP